MMRFFCILLLLLSAPLLANAWNSDPVSPPAGAIVPDSIITLTWNPVPGSNITYRLQVSLDSLFGITLVDMQALTHNQQVLSLSLGQIYYWRTAYTENGVSSQWSTPFRFQTFNPSLIPSVVAWFEPKTGLSASGQAVLAWQSHIGSLTMTQQNPARQPLLNDTLTFKAQGVFFDGIDDFLEGPFLNQSAFTLMALHNPLNKNSSLFTQARFTYTGFNWYINNSQRPSFNCLQTPANSAYIFSGHPYTFAIPSDRASIDAVTFNSGGVRLQTGYADTAAAQTISFLDIPSITTSRMGAMGNNSSYYKGVIYEFIIADTTLNHTDRALLTDYLGWKYQPPVNLGPDVHITYSFCDVELKPTHQYRSYLWSTGDTTPAITTHTPGYYWLSVTDFLGRTSSDTLLITKLLPAINLHDTIICHNSQASLNPGFTGAYQFSWNNNPQWNQPALNTSVAGSYTLVVTDSFQCSITDSAMVFVDNFALSVSLGPDRSVCQGEMLALTSGASQSVSYLWSTNSYDTLPHIFIQSPGSYAVTVSNQTGCSAYAQVNLILKGLAPVVGFQLLSPVCLTHPASFVDQSFSPDPLDAPASWLWSFGDGSFSSQQVTTHSYASPGQYPVILHVTTDSGCTGQHTDTLHVLPLPGVSIAHTAPCHSEEVHFSPGNSSLPVQSWSWHFYNLSPVPLINTSQYPAFIWPVPGDYPVTLTVTGNNGCNAKDSITLTVAQKPQALFSISPVQGCRSVPVSFQDQSIIAPSWPTTLRIWDFGDNTQITSGNQLVVHTYQQSGNYLTTLIVASSLSGCSDTAVMPLTIGELPDADIITDAGCSGKPIMLLENSTVLNDSIISWIWYADTLQPLSDKNPVVSFTDAGDYMLKLVVTSSKGCTDSAFKTLTVHPSPEPSFLVSPSFGPPPLTTAFFNNSSGADYFLWDFGDGNSSTLLNPNHTFTKAGVFSVKLTAFSYAGCQNSFSRDIFTIPPPIDVEASRLDVSISGDLLLLTVEFRNNSMVDLTRVDLYAWIMGENPLMESWQAASLADRLLPGHTRRYEFFSRIAIPETNARPTNLVCVRAVIPEFPTDTDPGNNTRCTPFREAFAVNAPFPNPAATDATLDIIIEIPDIVSIDMFDMQMRHVGTLFNQFLDTGLHRIQLPLASFLNAGTYTIRVIHRDHFEYRRIILFR